MRTMATAKKKRILLLLVYKDTFFARLASVMIFNKSERFSKSKNKGQQQHFSLGINDGGVYYGADIGSSGTLHIDLLESDTS
jgi:hypothetical protein